MGSTPKLPFEAGALGVSLICLALGCARELDGPEPGPPRAKSRAALDPAVVCRDQRVTEVALHGEGFTPLVVGAPDEAKTVLPTLRLTRTHGLDGTEGGGDRVVYSGDPDTDRTNANYPDGEPILVQGMPLLQWKSQREMSFLITPQLELGEVPLEGSEPRMFGMLAEGFWEASVQNPGSAEPAAIGALAVIDKPELETFSPGVVCVDGGARELQLQGRTFLRYEDERPRLVIDGADSPVSLGLTDCTSNGDDGLDADLCVMATAELKQGALEPGLFDLTIENPEPAACHSIEVRRLRVVPPPHVARVQPALGCLAEESRRFVIEGDDFLRVDGRVPAVSVAGTAVPVDGMEGCEPLEMQGGGVERCTALSITLGANMLEAGVYDVQVDNPEPAGCADSAAGVLRVVPPPRIEAVDPALVVLHGQPFEVDVLGSFLVVEGEQPIVELGGAALDPARVAPADCEAVDVEGATVRSCKRLALSLAANTDLGAPSVLVRNPAPVGCSTSRGDVLSIVAAPN